MPEHLVVSEVVVASICGTLKCNTLVSLLNLCMYNVMGSISLTCLCMHRHAIKGLYIGNNAHCCWYNSMYNVMGSISLTCLCMHVYEIRVL